MDFKSRPQIVVLGAFFVDLTCWTERMPKWGETFSGKQFKLSQGGKGSNQSVAASRLGASVSFITKVGEDAFGEMGLKIYREEKIDSKYVFKSKEYSTGTATILVDSQHGENAILIVPSACNHLTVDEVETAQKAIASADIFLTQLELPLPIVEHGLKLAHAAGVPTILNPAPALDFPDEWYKLVDYFTPNETEASKLSGAPVENIEQAEKAADFFLAKGVKNVLITLGKNGVLVKSHEDSKASHIKALVVKKVVDTTGAGDAFNGGLAVGLSSKLPLVEAVELGCTVAALSVGREGATLSMPSLQEVEMLYKENYSK